MSPRRDDYRRGLSSSPTSQHRQPSPDHDRTIVVKDLPTNFGEEDVRDLFGFVSVDDEYGFAQIESVSFRGQSTACVEFDDVEVVLKIMDKWAPRELRTADGDDLYLERMRGAKTFREGDFESSRGREAPFGRLDESRTICVKHLPPSANKEDLCVFFLLMGVFFDFFLSLFARAEPDRAQDESADPPVCWLPRSVSRFKLDLKVIGHLVTHLCATSKRESRTEKPSIGKKKQIFEVATFA